MKYIATTMLRGVASGGYRIRVDGEPRLFVISKAPRGWYVWHEAWRQNIPAANLLECREIACSLAESAEYSRINRALDIIAARKRLHDGVTAVQVAKDLGISLATLYWRLDALERHIDQSRN